ncbi:hypothetical protein pb186bvf_020869 [Paramecium bursaria]
MLNQKYILIILNTQANTILLQQVLQDAFHVICADGGANQLYDSNIGTIPQMIIGDLDSIRPDVVVHYRNLGVQIVQVEDQDHTDLEKALNSCYGKKSPIIIFGGFQGRLDHTIMNLSTLSQYQLNGMAISDQSIIRLIKKGRTVITLTTFETPKGCGIIPASFGTAAVMTEGFKWELTKDKPLVFGKFLSSYHRHG